MLRGESMKGSCLCGGIKFSFEKFYADIANCHCSMCRKFSGAAYGTFGTVNAENICWESGLELIKVFRSSQKAQRGFCSTCGSSIYYRLVIPNAPFEIALGLLEAEPAEAVTANIFCAYRPDWPRNIENIENYEESRTA
jgi:hypothetical protein